MAPKQATPTKGKTVPDDFVLNLSDGTFSRSPEMEAKELPASSRDILSRYTF